MSYIPRYLSQSIKNDLSQDNKIVVLFGARQVGKTTLARKILSDLDYKALAINAEQTKYHSILSSKDVNKFQELIADNNLLFIDEAQYIDEIGLNLKLIHDHLPQVKVFVTGSSSFDLANQVAEPLTGRSWKYTLYPISYFELKASKNLSKFELKDQLEQRLIFGSYPEVFSITGFERKQRHLQQLTNSYLFKDIFTFARIKYHQKIRQLLKLLAFQIGSEVSINELANQLGISRDAVNNYIDLLEKSFVIFRISSYSRNLRKEVTKMDKIYFYDLGVRNAVINDFKLFENRQDIGQLWENFLISEKIKINTYQENYCDRYFWRLQTGAELDYVEQAGSELHGYEFKWGNKQPQAPQSWQDTYPNSSYQVINQDNYLQFIT